MGGGGNVTETGNTIKCFHRDNHKLNSALKQNKDNTSMELLNVASQIFRIIFFDLSHFSQD